MESFINLREVSKRIRLPEGRFCIVPCTFSPGEECEFLLRVFIEKRWGSSEGGQVVDVQHCYGDTPDGSQSVSAALGGMSVASLPFKKQNAMKGFAMQQLKHHFPKTAGTLKMFYNWANNADAEPRFT